MCRNLSRAEFKCRKLCEGRLKCVNKLYLKLTVKLCSGIFIGCIAAQLSVEKISEGETYTKAETALESIVTEKTEVHLFDITLLDSENVKIQPDGKVTITIALEEKLEATEKVTVYRIEDDGTKTLMEGAKVVDGKVVFTTDHFSTYAVLVGEIVTVPKTGDTTTAGIYMMLFIAGAALVLVNKKQFVK